jgi:hypothetical protein
MDRLQFIVPIRVAVESEPVTEIYGVEDALSFLQQWRVGRDGPLFQKAFNACFSATVDLVTAEEARKALVNFARVAGILSRDGQILSDHGGDSLPRNLA